MANPLSSGITVKANSLNGARIYEKRLTNKQITYILYVIHAPQKLDGVLALFKNLFNELNSVSTVKNTQPSYNIKSL